MLPGNIPCCVQACSEKTVFFNRRKARSTRDSDYSLTHQGSAQYEEEFPFGAFLFYAFNIFFFQFD
jgi:hypothetical protein